MDISMSSAATGGSNNKTGSGQETTATFEPVGEDLRYTPPKNGIHPDTSLGWIRRMLPVITANGHIFLISISSALVMVTAQVLFPRWTGYIINDVFANPNAGLAQLEPYLWELGAITLVALGAGVIHRTYLMRTGYAIEYDLRVLMYQHFVRLSFPFYDRVQSGQLISRANSDIRAVQMFLAFGPSIAIQSVMFLIALYFMLNIHVGLTLLAISVMPVIYWYGVRMRYFFFPLSWIVQARTADVATIVDENINGVRVVKAFAAEKQQIGALSRAAQRLQWAAELQIKIRARFAPVMENIGRVGEAAVLLFGGILVIDGEIGPGDILVFMAYLVMLQGPFRLLGFIMMMGQRAAASALRIYEVLDEVPDIQDRPNPIDLLACSGQIDFKDVHFSYADGPEILDGFDLRVAAGETVAIVGRTGSGKTTVAQLLPRFYDVDTGTVEVDGHDVRDLSMASLRSHIAVCFDEPFLFSAALRDNIAYGKLDATLDEIITAAKIAGAHDFICNLENGYDTVVGERGYTLSGGQRQRIAIARAILENPKILILDDATSAIDVKVELQIHEGLQRLVRDRTTLIIAHRLSTISLADRVVLLERGKVVASGTHTHLMATEPRYAEVLAHLSEDVEAKVELIEEHAAHPHNIVEAEAEPLVPERMMDPDKEMN